MNTEILNRLKTTLGAITIDTDPFGVPCEAFTLKIDNDIIHVDDNISKVREDKNKYDCYYMALDDLVMFFKPSKATKTELIKLLELCENFEYCQLSGDFITALMTDDKINAQELKPQFEAGEELADITSATLEVWLSTAGEK